MHQNVKLISKISNNILPNLKLVRKYYIDNIHLKLYAPKFEFGPLNLSCFSTVNTIKNTGDKLLRLIICYEACCKLIIDI